MNCHDLPQSIKKKKENSIQMELVKTISFGNIQKFNVIDLKIQEITSIQNIIELERAIGRYKQISISF